MGDVADILGLGAKAPLSASEEASKILGDKPKFHSHKNAKKPKGMSREVFGLLGHESLNPSIQTNKIPVTQGFKTKRSTALKGKWVWAPFAKPSSSNSFSQASEQPKPCLYHWVKADVQYMEYPYAKFDIQLEKLTYTDDEYEHLLQNDSWTRSETDALMHACHLYDLRWPVIVDRYTPQPARTIEDMQHRFYAIVSTLRTHRTGSVAVTEVPPINNDAMAFDLEQEKFRRNQQELIFRRTREEEQEEMLLREELKAIDASLKKFKKTGKQASILSTASGGYYDRTLGSNTRYVNAPQDGRYYETNFNGSIGASSNHVDHVAPGRPGLQSSRLVVNENSSALSKTLVRKMGALLKELGAPEASIPTRTVCDMFDQVRRDAVVLLSLQTLLLKKEKELAALRAAESNSKNGIPIVLEHDVLLNRMPPPEAAPVSAQVIGTARKAAAEAEAAAAAEAAAVAATAAAAAAASAAMAAVMVSGVSAGSAAMAGLNPMGSSIGGVAGGAGAGQTGLVGTPLTQALQFSTNMGGSTFQAGSLPVAQPRQGGTQPSNTSSSAAMAQSAAGAPPAPAPRKSQKRKSAAQAAPPLEKGEDSGGAAATTQPQPPPPAEAPAAPPKPAKKPRKSAPSSSTSLPTASI